MRRTLLALAATTGLLGLGTFGAAAAPIAPMPVPDQARAAVQPVYWCGPRCESWHHRRWAERQHYWHHPHRYYGYNNYYRGNPYYR